MSSILDVLQSLFPDKSDAELTSYSQDPAVHDALKDLLPTPDSQTEDESAPPKTGTEDNETVNPSVADFKLPPANSTQSSFDVNESTSPVTMKGAMPIAPTGNVQQPNPSLPTPTPEAATIPPATPPVAPSTGVSKSTIPTAPTQQVAEAPLAKNLSDNDERQKMLAQEATKRKEGILPILLGGAGDAISTGATAFGANAGTPVLDKIVDMESKNITQDKTQFEDNLRNDPSSDVSRSYQKVLGMMMGKPQTDPDIQKMSANTIASQLPEVEKFMAKELGMKQIQANKELMLGERKDQFEDRAVNQGLARIASIRGDASLARSELQRDAAITVVNRINEVHNAGKELNPIDYTDMLGQTYQARTGRAPEQQIMNQIRQPLGSAQFNHAWTYLTGQQAPATSRDISNSLLNIAQSMGQQADKFHDAYMAPHLVKPSGVSDEKWAPVAKVGRGLSFAEATRAAQSNTNNQQAMTATNPKTGAKIKSTDGGQTWQPM